MRCNPGAYKDTTVLYLCEEELGDSSVVTFYVHKKEIKAFSKKTIFLAWYTYLPGMLYLSSRHGIPIFLAWYTYLPGMVYLSSWHGIALEI